MRTLLEILKLATDHLTKQGIANSRRQAEEVIGDAMGLSRIELYTQSDRPLVESELLKCREALSRRAKGEPAAYIHGEVDFLGCHLQVTPDVLIPRHETEILASKIALDPHEKVLWDICCGSGCLGIALKKRFPELTVILSDISPKALAVARKNGEQNNVDVTFREGDLLAPFKGEKAHFVVCNPPYIAESEYLTLEAEVKHEPRFALIAGPTGLEYYQRLAAELPAHLYPQAKVWFEIGTSQGKALTSLFQGSPWQRVTLEKDWAGHDRFFSLEY